MIRRWGWWFVVATVGAGLVGALRQAREARGRQAPPSVSVMARLPIRNNTITEMVRSAVCGGARVVDALAAWAPCAPRTLAGRTAARLWAAPLTLLGLVVGATSGGRPGWDPEHGCLVFRGAHTGSARLLAAVGASANAIGHVVVSRSDPIPPLLLAHEAGHVRQAERLGVALAPAYLWLSALYGYRNHPLERSARAAARRWRDQQDDEDRPTTRQTREARPQRRWSTRPDRSTSGSGDATPR